MKQLGIVAAVVVGIMVLAGGWFVSTQNSLVRLNETVNASWAQVENVYQRRSDLIPNLVNTVKGYAKHEQETLQAVVEARSQVGKLQVNSPETMKAFQQSQGQLTSALSRLMVVVEKYPELKANQNFLELQSQLEGTENRITVERSRFNQAVQSYNSSIQMFPTSIVAGMRAMTPKPYFDATPGSEKAPEVKF